MEIFTEWKFSVLFLKELLVATYKYWRTFDRIYDSIVEIHRGRHTYLMQFKRRWFSFLIVNSLVKAKNGSFKLINNDSQFYIYWNTFIKLTVISYIRPSIFIGNIAIMVLIRHIFTNVWLFPLLNFVSSSLSLLVYVTIAWHYVATFLYNTFSRNFIHVLTVIKNTYQ